MGPNTPLGATFKVSGHPRVRGTLSRLPSSSSFPEGGRRPPSLSPQPPPLHGRLVPHPLAAQLAARPPASAFPTVCGRRRRAAAAGGRCGARSEVPLSPLSPFQKMKGSRAPSEVFSAPKKKKKNRTSLRRVTSLNSVCLPRRMEVSWKTKKKKKGDFGSALGKAESQLSVATRRNPPG